MANGTVASPPQPVRTPAAPPSPTGNAVRCDEFIEKKLDHTQRQVKFVDVVSGVMTLCIGTLLFLLAAALLEHWASAKGLAFAVRFGLWLGWLGVAGTFAWRYVLPPLLHKINPIFAAQTIEKSSPSLKNSIINFLLLRGHREEVAPVVFRAMEQRAAVDLSRVEIEMAVDRGRLLRMAYILAGVVAAFALYVAISPKNPLVSAVRVLWPWSSLAAPTRVHIDDVSPGDVVAYRGERPEVSADVTGLRSGEEVVVQFRTADDGAVDQQIVMPRVGEGNHFACTMPQGSEGLQQDLIYSVIAGDAATPPMRIEVHIPPLINVERVDYHYPPYTGLKDRSQTNLGDVSAVEGTRVTIHATSNMEIGEAHIDLNCSGLHNIVMQNHGSTAAGQLLLRFDPYNNNRQECDSYQVMFTSTQRSKDGVALANHAPVRYRVEVERDLPPELQILEPKDDDVSVAIDGQATVRLRANDDFGLRKVNLLAECEGRTIHLEKLLDAPEPQKAWQGTLLKSWVFVPSKLGLKLGDVVALHAEAEDNKVPEPNPQVTGRKMIHIVAPGQAPPQANKPQQGGGNAGDSSNGDKQGPGGKHGKHDSNDAGGQSSEHPDQGDKDNADKSQPQSGQRGSPDDKRSPGQGSKNDQTGKPDSSKAQSVDPTGTAGNPQDNSGNNDAAASADQPKKVNQDTDPGDAFSKILNDKDKKSPASKEPDQLAKAPDQTPPNSPDPNNPNPPDPNNNNQAQPPQDQSNGGKPNQPNKSDSPQNQQPQSAPKDNNQQKPQANPDKPQDSGDGNKQQQNDNQAGSGQKPGSEQNPGQQGGMKGGGDQSGGKPDAKQQQQNGGKNSGGGSSGGNSSPDGKNPGQQQSPSQSGSGSNNPSSPQNQSPQNSGQQNPGQGSQPQPGSNPGDPSTMNNSQQPGNPSANNPQNSSLPQSPIGQSQGGQPQSGNPSSDPNAAPQGQPTDSQGANNPSNPSGSPQSDAATSKNNAQAKGNQSRGSQPGTPEQRSGQNRNADKQSASQGKSGDQAKNAGQKVQQQTSSGAGNENAADNGAKDPAHKPKGAAENDQLAQTGPDMKDNAHKSPSGNGGDKNSGGAARPEKKAEPKAGDKSGGQDSGGGQPKQDANKTGDEQKGGGGDKEGGQKKDGGQDPTGGKGASQSKSGEQSSKSPGGSKSKGGTASDNRETQQEQSKSGDPSNQHSDGAPDKQVDTEPGSSKPGQAKDGLNQNPNNAQSPGNSPKTGDASSDSAGDKSSKGGGSGGGGTSKNSGQGKGGRSSDAPDGGSISDKKGAGETGTKAGDAVKSNTQTGSAQKQSTQSGGQEASNKSERTNPSAAQANASHSPQSGNPSDANSAGGQSGEACAQQAGTQGSGQPTGGSASQPGAPPADAAPLKDNGADAANLAYAKKQVDLALRHLKDETKNDKSELLKDLGWSKEDAQRFIDNWRRRVAAAQQPGPKGAEAKHVLDESLRNLGLRPRGTRLKGGLTTTDVGTAVRDAAQSDPPAEWAQRVWDYNHATAAGGQK